MIDILFYKGNGKITFTVKDLSNNKTLYKNVPLTCAERMGCLTRINGRVYANIDIKSMAMLYFDEDTKQSRSYISTACKAYMDIHGHKNAWYYITNELWNEYFKINIKYEHEKSYWSSGDFDEDAAIGWGWADEHESWGDSK